MLALRAGDYTGALPAKTPRRKQAKNENDFYASGHLAKTPGPSKLTILADPDVPSKFAGETMTRPRRALGDKTPAANLRHVRALEVNLPTNTKGTKDSKDNLFKPMLVDDDLLLSVVRPSATRKTLKAPRFSVEKKSILKTPEPSGKNYWDVSDIDISQEVSQLILEEGPDYDEVEYMPPTAQIPEIDRDYDLPNMREIGETLRQLLFNPIPVPDPIISHESVAFIVPESDLRLSLRPPSPPISRSKVTNKAVSKIGVTQRTAVRQLEPTKVRPNTAQKPHQARIPTPATSKSTSSTSKVVPLRSKTPTASSTQVRKATTVIPTRTATATKTTTTRAPIKPAEKSTSTLSRTNQNNNRAAPVAQVRKQPAAQHASSSEPDLALPDIEPWDDTFLLTISDE